MGAITTGRFPDNPEQYAGQNGWGTGPVPLSNWHRPQAVTSMIKTKGGHGLRNSLTPNGEPLRTPSPTPKRSRGK